jgi:hypothetical protein
VKAFLVRLLSFASVFAVVLIWPKFYFVPIFAVGFVHFGLGFYYGRSYFKKSLRHPLSLSLQGLLLSLAILGFLQDSLTSSILFFGIHLALTEAWDPQQKKQTPLFHGARFIFYLSSYLIASEADLSLIPAKAPLIFFIPLFALALSTFSLRRRTEELAGSLPGDLLFLAICGIFYFSEYSDAFKVPFLISYYHFMFWVIGPALYRGKELKGQLALNLALTAVIFCILMTFLKQGPERFPMIFSQYKFWSYFHFAFSLSTSRANPQWIINLFQLGSLKKAPVP